MKTQRLHRALRKLLRPLRRRLQGVPTPASLDEFTGPTLVLIAHPDDEVFCSGLVCQLLERGQEVHLVSFTRGEGGERGAIDQEAKLSRIREEELTRAAEALSITSLTFLDYVDPVSKDGNLQEPAHDSSELLAELENLVSKLSIHQLVTHGSSGEYWHPAHLCLHRQTRVLYRRLPQLKLWTFNAWNPRHPLPGVLNQDDPAHLTLDSTRHHEIRLTSLRCHLSQEAVFQRFANGRLEDFITLTNLESFRKW